MKFLFVPIWGYNVNNDYKEQVKQFKVEERKLSKRFSEEHCFSPDTIVTTVEIETLEELLKLVHSVKGEVVLATPDYFNSFSYSSQRDILSEWQLTQAVGNICDVLERIEGETRYFESL